MVHEKAGPEALGVFRFFVFGAWAVQTLGTPVARAADLPFELFDAPGVLSLLPPPFWEQLFQPAPLIGMQTGLVLVFTAAALGVRPFPLVGGAAIIGMLALDGIAKGWGAYVNHAQMAILYAGVLVAVSPAADGFSPRPRPSPSQPKQGAYRFPLVGTALILSVTYALIGGHRLAVGGWEIFAGDALPTYVAVRTFEYSAYAFQLSFRLLESPGAILALKAGFVVATIFEILSPFALVYRRFRHAWLLVIIPFHFATLVTMNIFFWENLILLLLVFTELPTRLGAIGRSPCPTAPLIRRFFTQRVTSSGEV